MQVIYETLRLATVVNGLLRKTTQDVEMNGENPTRSILLLLKACKTQASSNAIFTYLFQGMLFQKAGEFMSTQGR